MLFLKRWLAFKGTSPVTKITIPLFAAMIGLCVWLVQPTIVYVLADSLSYDSPDGTYQYSTTHYAEAPTEIEVTFDISDDAAIEQYRQSNQARSQMLLESAQGERLWTTLTFAKPISLHAMRTLLQEAQVEAVSYTQVGWTTTGERMGTAIFASDNADFDVEKATKEAISQDPNAPDYKAQMAGFMMVDGYLTVSQESLGKLVRDNRLYIIDTTAHEVKQLAKADEATVRLSSPFWNMDWGLNQSQQKIYLPFINK